MPREVEEREVKRVTTDAYDIGEVNVNSDEQPAEFALEEGRHWCRCRICNMLPPEDKFLVVVEKGAVVDKRPSHRGSWIIRCEGLRFGA